MKAGLLRICLVIAILLAIGFRPVHASLQASETADSLTLSHTITITDTTAKKVKTNKRNNSLDKEQRKIARQKKEKERLAKKPTFEEFLSRWQPYNPCGDQNVDAFCLSASNMVLRYKHISDSLNFIRIEIMEIPDSGDGITKAVKITDGNGNPRTKESVSTKWADLGVQIAVIAIDLPILVISGTNIVTSFIDDPTRLLNFGMIGQLRRSIQALNMLTIEIRRSVPVIKEQTALLKSAKQN